MQKIECRADPKDKDVLQIYVDDIYWRKIHLKIFGRNFRLKELSLEQLKEWIAEEEYQKAKRYLAYCLSLKGYFVYEIRQRFSEYFVDQEIAENIISEFIRYGYLDDQERLKSLIQSYQQKKLGPQAIKTKLFAKKIPAELIEEGMALINSETLKTSLKDWIAKKSKNMDLSDFKVKSKLFQMLLRKGFSYQDIRDELDKNY